MDRDRSGFITSAELNCDEFQEVLRSILTPQNRTEKCVTYARAELSIQQAIGFCMRKADMNSDGSLSFEEFRSFLRTLRNQSDAKHTANLIFALFDLDCSLTIDREEFKEIYRYYNGHVPTSLEVEAEWAKIDPLGKEVATRDDYVRWLQTSANPIFRQHAPKVAGSGESEDDRSSNATSKYDRKLLKGIVRPAPGLLPQLRRQANPASRPSWNDRLNPKDVVTTNPSEPKRRKQYFSRYQTEPELKLFYDMHVGFADHAKRLSRPEDPKPKIVLSTESEKTRPMLPGRHVPAGRMPNKSGKPVAWTDAWQTPRSMKTVKRDPGTLLLRCPGAPPEWTAASTTASKDLGRTAMSRSASTPSVREVS